MKVKQRNKKHTQKPTQENIPSQTYLVNYNSFTSKTLW